MHKKILIILGAVIVFLALGSFAFKPMPYAQPVVVPQNPPASPPPEKQAIEQQYSQERAAGAQHPAPKNPAAPYPIAPGQPFPTGILDDCAAPFSSSEANIVNCWAGLLNGSKTVVYAGAEGKEGDPQQGVVYVVVIPGYPADVSGGRVITPIKGRTVRIVAAHDAILKLVSEPGSY